MTAAGSVPSRYSRVVTALLALAIVGAWTASMARRSPNKLRQLERPAAVTIMVHERTITMAAASDGGWWARFRGWAVDLPARPLEVAIAAYADALPPVTVDSETAGAALALRTRRAAALAQVGRAEAISLSAIRK